MDIDYITLECQGILFLIFVSYDKKGNNHISITKVLITNMKKYACLENTVYENSWWGYNTDILVESLIDAFKNVLNPLCPAELVYTFGGNLPNSRIDFVSEKNFN